MHIFNLQFQLYCSVVLIYVLLCCMFQAALNTEDPQYQDKRMVAQRNGKLSVQVFHVWFKYFC